MEYRPYTNTQIKESNNIKTFIRHFPFNTDDIEFKWHKDLYNRSVKIIQGENWLMQHENEIPIELKENHIYYIEKDKWHRIIKGKNDLIVEITEFLL